MTSLRQEYQVNLRCSSLPAVIQLRVIMSGALEKVSSMKAYGGDLIKFKFKVGRVSCGFSRQCLLIICMDVLGSVVCRSRWFRCAFQSVLT